MSAKFYLLAFALTFSTTWGSHSYLQGSNHENEKYYMPDVREEVTFGQALMRCILGKTVPVNVKDLDDEELQTYLNSKLGDAALYSNPEFWLTMADLDLKSTNEMALYFFENDRAGEKQKIPQPFRCFKFKQTSSGPTTSPEACDKKHPFVCKYIVKRGFFKQLALKFFSAVAKAKRAARWIKYKLKQVGHFLSEELKKVMAVVKEAIKASSDGIDPNHGGAQTKFPDARNDGSFNVYVSDEDDLASFFEASEKCTQRNMQLVYVLNEAENVDLVRRILKVVVPLNVSVEYFWIGGYRAAENRPQQAKADASEYEDEQFVWYPTSARFNYSKWNNDHPLERRPCVILAFNLAGSGWQTTYCTRLYRYVCRNELKLMN